MKGATGPETESALRERIGRFDEADFRSAVINEISKQTQAFADGVNAYHRFARRPRPDAAPVLAEFGAAKLYDYGFGEGDDQPPVLLVPSLINRSYILDLTEKRSLARYMAAQGLRPLLVDWGHPGEHEADYDLGAYITGPLQSFFDIANAAGKDRTAVLGYCMGGLLALALTQRNPGHVASLSLLATPWDFHADKGANLVYLKALRPGLEVLLKQLNHLPVDILQAMFASLNPCLTSQKFQNFGKASIRSESADAFVALEDWLNDGVPLVAGVARECLFEWYLENSPAAGTWSIAGQVIEPERLTCPTLTYIPDHDHIVPPTSAHALADRLPNNESRTIAAGHIGMVSGRNMAHQLYAPLTEWIKSHR